MKAAIVTKYGTPEVLSIKEIQQPVPKKDELLIKVIASAATTADCMIRSGTPKFGRIFLGLFKPKKSVIGTGFSGIIQQMGEEVSNFTIGDEVFGETALNFGANAEFIVINQKEIVLNKPTQISFNEAAVLCDGALTSLNFLKTLANIQPNQKVLINGASGSLGTAAVQLAHHFGAYVVGVCSTTNIDLVTSLGADEVIDYTKADFTKLSNQFDLIYDTIGKSSFKKCKNSLTKKGIYASPVLSLGLLFTMLFKLPFGKKKAKFSATGLLPVHELKVLLFEIKASIVEGKFKPVIDQVYPLDQIKKAHQYIETGRKKGNVVLQS